MRRGPELMPANVVISPLAESRSTRRAGILELLDVNQGLLLAMALIAAYYPPLTRSLWVDEAGTWWMACRGPLAAIERTSHWPGQSILFAVITSFFCVDPSSPLRDLLLRIPALLGGAAACYFIYRLADDMFGKGAGKIAAVLFTFNPATIELATQARPYSLAMAATAASCWTLYRWAQSRERAWLAGYVVASVLVISFHYLFSVIFAVHAAFICCEFISGRSFRRIGDLFAAGAVMALLVMPLASHIRLLLSESHTLSFGTKPSGLALAQTLMPPIFTACVFAAGLIVHFAWPRPVSGVPLPPAASVMLMAWWSFGPLLFFGVASATSAQVFVDRYLSCSGLALALLLTYAGYSMFGARTGAIWALIVVLLTSANVLRLTGESRPSDHELRPFMQVISKESADSGPALPPVMFQSSLVESNFYDWRSGDHSPQGYLFAPFSAYPMKNRLVPLPFQTTSEVEAYIADELNTDLKEAPKVILITHEAFRIQWFADRFRMAGFNSRVLHLNDYWVMVFEHGPRATSR
jgi:hypothetical protein